MATQFAVIADLHLHPFRQFSHTREDGQNSWVAETMTALEAVYDECNKRGIDHIVLAGDVFHVGDRIYTRLYNQLREFFRMKKALGYRTVLIAGNHDQVYRGGRENILMGLEDVVDKVVSTPVIVESLGSHSVCFVPYTEDAKQLDKVLKTWMPETDGFLRVVVGHLAMASSKIKISRFEFTPEKAISPSIFKGIDLVMLGHYHTSQTMKEAPNIVYAGSLTATSFSDTGCRKGFMIIKIGTKVTFDFVPIPHTRFEVLTPEAPIPDVTGSIIRVDYTGVLDETAFRAKLHEAGARAVVFNCKTPTVTEVRVTTKTGKEPTQKQYMNAFIAEHGEGFDKAKLLRTGLKLMES